METAARRGKTSTKKRNEKDFYQTPYSMVWQLMEREKFEGIIMEPCSGKGAIVRALDTAYRRDHIKSGDIMRGYNFYEDTGKYDTIITNPPYKDTLKAIQKFREMCKKKMALLMPINHLSGQRRYESGIWENLQTIYTFTRMPMLTKTIRPDGKYHTGMQIYCWYIWDFSYHGPAVHEWIENSMYVLKKGDA